MISSRKKSALAKFLVSLYKMKMPKVGVSIRWIPKDSNEIGYTYRRKNSACIYLNANQKGKLSSLFEGLDDNQAIFFITGVAVHEFMHQILTNFVLFGKMLNTYTDPRAKNLFKTVFNLFEDSRIESYAPSYFAGETISALNFTIKRVWETSPNNNPEDNIIRQVIAAMCQYGDLGTIKPELSDEAKELFNKINPLFDEAIDTKSCAICLSKAKQATSILLPYIEDVPEEDYSSTDSSDCDSEGEDAEDSDASRSSRRKKIGKSSFDDEGSDGSDGSDGASVDESEDKSDEKDSGGASEEDGDSEKSEEADSEEKPEESSDGSDEDSGEESDDKSSEEHKKSESGEGDIAPEKGESQYLDGCSSAECMSFEDDPEEVENDSEASPEDFEKSIKELEKTLEVLEKSEEEAEKGEESDYDFGSAEYPTTDKYVKVISHHKATSNPEVYEEYRKIVESDAHELAKLIKRQFKTKPGRVKRADHGDLNLMRYKDPNFRSPLIFDKKKPREKHCAAVMLLVDESGSMGGRRITNARLAAIMLAEAMAEAGIPCSVVGHSGDDRYNYSVELEHYTTFKNASADRASLAMIEARCQNRDGPAIRWASSILKKRPERNKLMIVISDGQPAADRYYGEEAIFDTKAAIRDAKRLHNIVGVILEAGSSTDILKTMYGNDYVECTSSKNLKESIAKIITSQCKNW
jgi:cobalamin biosynthesis protein CobT